MLDSSLSQEMWKELHNGGREALTAYIFDLRVGDIQLGLRQLEPEQSVILFQALPIDIQSELLEDLPPELRDACLESMSDEELVKLVTEAASDEAVYYLDQLEDDRVKRIFEQLEERVKKTLHEQYHLPEDCAGRIMSDEFVAVQAYTSVEQTLRKLRSINEDKHEGALYVVDARGRLEGEVSYRSLALSEKHIKVHQIIDHSIPSVDINTDEADIPDIMVKHNMSTIPVTKGDRVLCGVINWDDAVEIMEDEVEEDMLAVAGTAENFEDNEHVLRRAGHRLPYLLITLIGGFIMASMIDTQLEHINDYSLLVALIPMVPALAGNIGIQCSTVTLRYIVTGNISPSRIRSRIFREVSTGLILAIVIATLTGVGVFGYIIATGGELLLGCAITLAMLIAIILAALFGTFVPIACDKMNIDPAIAAGPFITMLNDIVGVGVYLITALSFIQFL